jgi:AsmA protein
MRGSNTKLWRSRSEASTAQVSSYGLDINGLTGNVQEQVQKKAEEAVGGLLKGTTRPED